MKKLLGSRGDTIVEVMIALAVLSLILGGSYISASSSLRGTRRAQERGEALKITEQQIEQLKAAHATGVNVFAPVAGSNFCIYLNTTPPDVNKLATKSIPAAPSPHPGECQKSISGGVAYRISVTRTEATPGDPLTSVFNVTCKWDRAGGGADDTLTMAYRL